MPAPKGAIAGAEAGAEADPDGPTAAQAVALSVLEDLPDGSSALVLAVEHLWAIPLRDAVRDAGGVVLAARSLTPEKMVVLGMLAAVVDEAVEEIEAEEASAEAADEG